MLAQNNTDLDTSAFAAYVKEIFFTYAIPLAVGGAILMFAIGGLMIIYSGGDASKIQNGKDIITGTIIGLILMLLASIILAAIDPDLAQYFQS
ncbi:MAG: hypothetical protein PHW50_01350 [Patescibacteria group bacterium]|nr:hypothetical protein [Patescibacteria group bacterium]